MDRIELLKIIKYVLTAVADHDRYKIMALDAHLETVRASEHEQGNLYVAREVVNYALKEM